MSRTATIPRHDVTGHRRIFHAATSAAAILILGWWSWYSDPDPDFIEVMRNPAAYAGHEIKIGDEPILESVEPGFFVVNSCGFRLRVSGDLSPDDTGHFIYVRGTFQPAPPGTPWNGLVESARYRVARGRHAKIWISVIPTFWVGILLLRHFRFETRRFAIEERCPPDPLHLDC
ncbi:hypothetical protein GC176_06435 [bacterium]|nr:hypothetical protein [bacterium]